jgi:hypothetical protein
MRGSDAASYFLYTALAAATVFGLDAGFFFAAGAGTPNTDSFSALAGVKRSRVLTTHGL